jgi:hypothetical protein
MPKLSCLQVFFCSTFPLQQLAFALHSTVCKRQMPPAGVQAFPLSQRPSAAPGVLLQWMCAVLPFGRPSAPQQSVSLPQISPVGWHPLGG